MGAFEACNEKKPSSSPIKYQSEAQISGNSDKGSMKAELQAQILTVPIEAIPPMSQVTRSFEASKLRLSRSHSDLVELSVRVLTLAHPIQVTMA
ncbi:hypothetical protein PAXRUDRAFT_744747 [Paxillus rubicundulus Ve08.2h10]|uniref:Uncharacterized protein n=1 Tax=Paxillus rubicundulus Ve08.2h10 TaxID=930991 RepID=A0A0D0CGA2_9AGAM|nr:hypothetical protein PAXRUDRAFT_744747 [Paxillus rubicundulus Ve08.2h10]